MRVCDFASFGRSPLCDATERELHADDDTLEAASLGIWILLANLTGC